MGEVTILYITMARIPGERAHSIQIARMCSALQEAGSEVFLISARRGDEVSRKATMAETMKYYGLRTPFMHQRVPVLGLLGSTARKEYFSWLLSVLVLALFALTYYAVFKILLRKNVYMFIREPLVLIVTNIIGWLIRPKMIYEVHEIPASSFLGFRFFWSIMQRVQLIICIARVLAELVKQHLSSKWVDIVVLHDAVDEEAFNKKDGEPNDLSRIRGKSKVIMYAGQLDEWKNPEFLVNMMEHIKERDSLLVFVGGRDNDILRLKRYVETKGLSDRVFFLGWRPPAQIPSYLSSADVLVHYSPPSTALSPLKVFEYMLSGRPIVAPKAPGVDEVLTDGVNALLFDPYDPSDAARKVSLLLKDKELGDRLASAAKNTALSKFTYKARAATLLNLLNSKTHQKHK